MFIFFGYIYAVDTNVGMPEKHVRAIGVVFVVAFHVTNCLAMEVIHSGSGANTV